MKEKDIVKKQFGRRAEQYVASHTHRKGDDLHILIQMAQLQGNENVLDVATGGGHTANAFAPLVHQVTAMDITPEMIAAAARFIRSNGHENVKFIEGDAENMPFSDHTFDIVTCRIAAHHFPNLESFIREVYRVLKPGGQFLIDDNVAPEDEELDQFYNAFEKIRDHSHQRAWKKTEWFRMVELNEFNTEMYYRYEKRFDFESWCNRMNLSKDEKATLNEFMINGTEKAKQKFQIEVIDRVVDSFIGEAMLLKAIKQSKDS